MDYISEISSDMSREKSEYISEYRRRHISGVDNSEIYSDICAMHAHADIIKRLGGGSAVAARLSALTNTALDRERVYKWQINGVPWEFRVPLARILIGQGIAVPSGFLPEGVLESALQPFGPEPSEAA